MTKKETNKEESIPENPFSGFNILTSEVTSETKDVVDELTTEEVIKDNTPEEEEELIKAEKEHLSKNKKETPLKVVQDEVAEVEETPIKEESTEFSYKPLIQYLAEKDIVSFNAEDLDKFEDTDEALESVINNTVVTKVNDGIKSYKDSLSDATRKLVEFEELGGDPKQFMDLYYGNHSYENIDISESEVNQKLVIRQGLRLAGLDDAEIEEELNEIEDLGKLENKAKLYLPKIQKVEKQQKDHLIQAQKQYAIEQEEERVKYWNELKDNLYTKEDIKGFKLTDKLKNQIWDHMTKPVDKAGKTKLQINNETRKDAQFLYAYLDMLDFDISRIEKKADTKATSALRQKLGNFTDSRVKVKSGKTEVQGAEDSPFAAFKTI